TGRYRPLVDHIAVEDDFDPIDVDPGGRLNADGDGDGAVARADGAAHRRIIDTKLNEWAGRREDPPLSELLRNLSGIDRAGVIGRAGQVVAGDAGDLLLDVMTIAVAHRRIAVTTV